MIEVIFSLICMIFVSADGTVTCVCNTSSGPTVTRSVKQPLKRDEVRGAVKTTKIAQMSR